MVGAWGSPPRAVRLAWGLVEYPSLRGLFCVSASSVGAGPLEAGPALCTGDPPTLHAHCRSGSGLSMALFILCTGRGEEPGEGNVCSRWSFLRCQAAPMERVRRSGLWVLASEPSLASDETSQNHWLNEVTVTFSGGL